MLIHCTSWPKLENGGHVAVPPPTHSPFLSPEQKPHRGAATLAVEIESRARIWHGAKLPFELCGKRRWRRVEDVELAPMNERTGRALGTMIAPGLTITLHLPRADMKPAADADTEPLHRLHLDDAWIHQEIRPQYLRPAPPPPNSPPSPGKDADSAFSGAPGTSAAANPNSTASVCDRLS